MKSVLVIDDDQGLRELLAEYLTSRGLKVECAEDGETGIHLLRGGRFDLVVLDVMMPGLDGFETTRQIRSFTTTPIIMLTARGDEMDRIVGLELGADDYLAKPFNPRELLARIHAVLRRAQADRSTTSTIVAGPLCIDVDRRTAQLNDKLLDLTTTEFEILRILAANAGRVIPRERLMELARGEAWAAFDRSVDVHISHLRKKLGEDSKRPSLIKTVRGVGYTFATKPE
jgi:two-component system OmpR family response regulator